MLYCKDNVKVCLTNRGEQVMTKDTNTENTKTVSDTLTDTDAPTLSSSAMLVEINISKWTGRKFDKSASAYVENANNAHVGMANVHKKLLGDCPQLSAIHKHVSNSYNIHRSSTLPWSDSGLRLVPTVHYFKYHQQMTDLRNHFTKLCDEFFDVYDFAIQEAKTKLGDLFQADNYPSIETIKSKFAWRMNYTEVPQGDFRVDIGNEGLRQVKEQFKQFSDTQIKRAMGDAWQRTYNVLSRMSERLDYTDDEDKKVFRDTIVTNVTDLIDLLDGFNLTNDPNMKAMKIKLDKIFRGVTPDALREDGILRLDTKKAVDEAIKALPSLDI